MRRLFVVIALIVTSVAANAQHWTPPRTPWGDPDLQGLWPGVEMLGVPLQRPAGLGEKATLTDEEVAQLPAQRRTPNDNDNFIGESQSHWREYGKPQHQTSLIVDPSNGRYPAMTAEGQKRFSTRPSEARGPLDGPENVSAQARCLSRGTLGSMLPIGNSSGNQIIQSPGWVVIRNEMIHEARLIPVDGRPHVGAKIRSYMGNARGWWDGNTLVVETTNFDDRNNGVNTFSGDARLTERFTRTAPDTIRYDATIDDSRTWTQAWSVSFPLKQDPSYELFEFACHEGNFLSMSSMLGGARLLEK